jgi:hypothetical protein
MAVWDRNPCDFRKLSEYLLTLKGCPEIDLAPIFSAGTCAAGRCLSVVPDDCERVSVCQSHMASGRAEWTPLYQRVGAAGPEIVPAGEGALSVEAVVD